MARVVHRGVDPIAARLRQLPAKFRNKIARKALRAGAHVLHAAVLQNVARRTGRLARSVKVRASRTKKPGAIRFAVVTSEKDNMFTGDAFYGAFMEFGFKAGPRRKDNRKQIAPRPAFRPAIASHGQAAINRTAEVARQEIATAGL